MLLETPQRVLCEEPNFSHRPQFRAALLNGDSFHISRLVDWFGSCRNIEENPIGFTEHQSLCFGLGGCSVTHCWPGVARAGLSGWSSCRVIPVSDLALGPNAQWGRQVPLRPVTQQTKHSGIWHWSQQLTAIKSSHMIPIHFIPY